MTPTPDLGPQEYELQLTHRQVVTVLLLLLTVMGLVAAMAYIAGRSVTAMRFARETGQPEVKRGPMLVEPSGSPTPAPTATAVPRPSPATTPTPSPVTARTARPAPTEVPPTREPGVAQVAEPPPGAYLQVGSVDLGVARAFHEYLSRREFPVRIAPGASPNAYRVVIGPLGGQKEIQETEIRLKNAGFPSFLKRY